MTRLCSPAPGCESTEMPSSNAFICGRPQTNTSTLRMIHGIHARMTSRATARRRGRHRRTARCRSPADVATRRAAARLAGTARARPSRRPRRRRPPATARGSSRRGTAASRTPTPATRIAGQTPSMPRQPANAQTSQNGTITEKNGSCRPTIALSSSRSRPVTLCSAMIGVPSAPKATGAVLAMSDRPEAASGVKPRPIRIAPVTATGVPKPAAPSKNAPKQNATSSSCSRAIVGDVRDALRAASSNRPRSFGQLIEEDDVEDDPADRQQAVGRAVAGGGERHRRRHAERRRSPPPARRRGRPARRCARASVSNASAPSSTTTGSGGDAASTAHSAPNGS